MTFPPTIRNNMSLRMGKPTICLVENKGADQLRSYLAVTAKLISAFVFATWIVQFLYFLNPNFPVSSHLLCLYRSVYIRPARSPHCWFFHEVAQLCDIVWLLKLSNPKRIERPGITFSGLALRKHVHIIY